MKTTIPFQGFYNTIHDSELDHMLKYAFENPKLREHAFDCIDWYEVHFEYAKAYTKLFRQRFNIELKFTSISSPKYYNYETDRIHCEIDIKEVSRLFKLVNKDTLRKVIKKRFTSCSGFISHYPNSLDLWDKDLRTWDMNQVETLIQAYILDHDEYSEEYDIYILGDMEAYAILDRFIPSRFFKIRDRLEKHV